MATTLSELHQSLRRLRKPHKKAQILTAYVEEHWLSQPADCLSLAQQALSLAAECDNPEVARSSAYWAARCHYALAQYDRALSLLHLNDPRQSQAKEDTAREVFRWLLLEGVCYERRRELEQAQRSYETALQNSRSRADTLDEAQALVNIALLDCMRENYTAALRQAGAALPLFEEADFHTGLDEALGIFANVYHNLGDYPAALEYNERRLKLARATDNRPAESAVQANIGVIYNILEDNERALRYFEESLEIAKSIGLVSRKAFILRYLGVIASETGDYTRAGPLLEESRRLREASGQNGDLAILLNEIGLHYERQELMQEALQCFADALRISEAIDDQHTVAVSLMFAAQTRRAIGEVEDALTLLRRSLAIVERLEVPAPEMLHKLHLNLCSCYKKLSTPEATARAFDHHERHFEYYQAFENERKRQMMLALRLRLETEEYDQKLARLDHAITDLRGDLQSKTQILAVSFEKIEELRVLLHSLAKRIDQAIESSASRDELSEQLAAMPNEIRRAISTTTELQQLESVFEQNHPMFHARLIERCSALTTREILICKMIYNKLTSKEMAEVLNNSARTIETHRLRIRKKLALESDTDLMSFFIGLDLGKDTA